MKEILLAEKPQVLLWKWQNTTESERFTKLFLVPFEQGYNFFDKPRNILNPIKSLPSYVGEFERLTLDKNKIETASKQKIPNIIPRLSEQMYVEKVIELKKQIKHGNIYEINFCFDFIAQNVELPPYNIFQNLANLAQAPFTALVKWGNYYIMVASPERYLKKVNNTLIAQPMKGTRKLSLNNEKDAAIINELKNNAKEQNENVMIVDLVRNDLSRIACRNSVKVDELYGVYTFRNIAQMISTISCQISNEVDLSKILHYTFPMGSMTGAPKPMSLELINKLESAPRGFYSGALGFIDEEGNFDSCVIIRSIFYDGYNKTLSFSVGSAITDMCNPKEEYKECLLKAENMLKAIYGN